MSNDYFTKPSPLIPNTDAKAQDVNEITDSTDAGFDILPENPIAGEGWSDPIKVGTPTDPLHATNKNFVETAMTSQVNAAAASAAAALASQNAAAASASAASGSASAAAGSASAASTSASNAAASASAASTSASNAATSASTATTQATNASNSASAASASAAAAAASATTATTHNTVDYAVAAGTGNAITAAFTPAITSLVDGLKVRIKIFAKNGTGAVTFTPDAQASRPVWNHYLQPITDGLFLPSYEAELTYSSVSSAWIVTSPISEVISEGVISTSGDTNIPIPSGPWPNLKLVVNNLLGSADFVLFLRLGDTGNRYDWSYSGASGVNDLTDGAVNASGIALTRINSSLADDSNTTPNPINFTLNISNPNDAVVHNIDTTQIFYNQANGTVNSLSASGRWKGSPLAAATTAQLLMRPNLSSSPSGSPIAALAGGTWRWTT